MLTAPIGRSLLLVLRLASVPARAGALTAVLNHDLLVSQLLDRALVLFSDALQPVLHPVPLVLAVSVVTALMAIANRSTACPTAVLLLGFFLETCLNHARLRLR